MLLNRFQNDIYPLDAHVGGIDEFIKFEEFVPYLLLENSLWSYGEAIAADEIGLALITKVWIILQKGPEPVLSRLEFAVFVLEHTDCSSGVEDQDLREERANSLNIGILFDLHDRRIRYL